MVRGKFRMAGGGWHPVAQPKRRGGEHQAARRLQPAVWGDPIDSTMMGELERRNLAARVSERASNFEPSELHETKLREGAPEEKYCCAPTAGEFAGARIFAQQVKHLAVNNYGMSAYMLTQTPTPDQECESGPDGVRSKPQIMDYVKGSFAALDRAFAATKESNMVKPLAIPIRQKTRPQLAVDAVATPTITVARWWNTRG